MKSWVRHCDQSQSCFGASASSKSQILLGYPGPRRGRRPVASCSLAYHALSSSPAAR